MKYLSLILLIISISACGIDTPPSADQIQAEQTSQMSKAAAQAIGMPNITNFTEKRFAKLIYELKDQEVTTYSYFMDMQGRLHFLCESIGYGLSASVQYSNPQRVLHGPGTNGRSAATIPQPEPNGLFMPEGLAATFVLCSDDRGGVRPVYSEPELIVSPFKLNASSELTGS
ncbi:MAG: hypothetical protein K6L81_02470 [Agarilytica sp.]